MMKQKFIEIIFKALEFMIMLGLLVAALFFVKDVWHEYQLRDTSFKTTTSPLKSMKRDHKQNDVYVILAIFNPLPIKFDNKSNITRYKFMTSFPLILGSKV